MEIDTFNKFMVAVGGKDVILLKPIPQKLSADDALLLAAYLVSTAEINTETKFEDVLKAVQNC